MITTILIPLDGSELAERALSPARRLAGTIGASLTLLRVVQPGTLHFGAAALDTALADADAYLHGVAESLTYRGLEVHTDVLAGDAAETIVLAAAMRHADLIVMSTHGRSGWRRALLGSVAQAVLHNTMVPTMLVRLAGEQLVPSTHYSRILVPLDGSRRAESALRYIVDQQIARSAEVILLRVLDPMASMGSSVLDGMPMSMFRQVEEETERQLAGARFYLDFVAQTYLAPRSVACDTAVMLNDPVTTILHVAEARKADMIAMSTHHRIGGDRILVDDVAEAVLHKAAVPVLLLGGATMPSQAFGVSGKVADGEPDLQARAKVAAR